MFPLKILGHLWALSNKCKEPWASDKVGEVRVFQLVDQRVALGELGGRLTPSRDGGQREGLATTK